MRKRVGIIAAAVAGLAIVSTTAVWTAVASYRNRLVWDHFDVVKPGILYRSGQLHPDQLVEVIQRYGIQTVISFQVPGEEVATERAIAREQGIDFINLPMPGDGFGQEAQFREVLAACDDPARRPVLVHCARGTCRTGAAVALYRFERDGWSLKDVTAEMERQTYRRGWLAGYIYSMVEDKPPDDLFQPQIVHDRNLPAHDDFEEAPDVR